MSGFQGECSAATSRARAVAVSTRGCVQITPAPRKGIAAGVLLSRRIRKIATGRTVDFPEPVFALTISTRSASPAARPPYSGILLRSQAVM